MSARLAQLRKLDTARRAVDQVIRQADPRIATVTAILVHHHDPERDDTELFPAASARDAAGRLVHLPADEEIRVSEAIQTQARLSTERPVLWTVGVNGRPGGPRLDLRLPQRWCSVCGRETFQHSEDGGHRCTRCGLWNDTAGDADGQNDSDNRSHLERQR